MKIRYLVLIFILSIVISMIYRTTIYVSRILEQDKVVYQQNREIKTIEAMLIAFPVGAMK